MYSPISIHAPRTGSDLLVKLWSGAELIFQSTLPARGATYVLRSASAKNGNFNPRSPHGERHQHLRRYLILCYISIHAPRTGSDAQNVGQNYIADNFNPRSPHGERRDRRADNSLACAISIHAPRTGSDVYPTLLMAGRSAFQSTLPARGATVSA